MKYVAAFLLAQLSGKESPSADDVKAVLAGASAEVDDAKLSQFMAEVEGKDIAALIEEVVEEEEEDMGFDLFD